MFGFTQEQVDRKIRVAVEEARATERRILDREREDHKAEILKINAANEIQENKLIADQLIQIQEKEFEIKHTADERVKAADDARVLAETQLAVSEKENEMLHKIVDDRADVLEIKDLVRDLLNKIPEIKIDTLSVQSQKTNDGKSSK